MGCCLSHDLPSSQSWDSKEGTTVPKTWSPHQQHPRGHPTLDPRCGQGCGLCS